MVARENCQPGGGCGIIGACNILKTRLAMMKYKRSTMLILGLAMAAFLAWLLYSALQPSVLPLGTVLPQMPYETSSGKDHLQMIDGKPTVVMLFSRQCPHCLYELNLFEKNIHELTGSRLYLITVEPDFKIGLDNLRWPSLSSSNEIIWGKTAEADFKHFFGTPISPSIYIFNRRGKLQQKIRGEVKFDKILENLG
jgi:peroxiredoxin